MRHLNHRRQSLDDFFSDRKQEQEDRHPEEEEPHSYDHFPTYQPLAPEPEEPKPTSYAPTNNLQRYFQAISQHPQLSYEQLVHWAKQMDEGRAEFRCGLLVEAHHITYSQLYSLEDQLRRDVISYHEVLDEPRGKEEEVMGNFYRHLAQLKQAIEKVPFPIEKKQRQYSQKNRSLLLQAAGLGEKLPIQPSWWQKTAAKVYASSTVSEGTKEQLQKAYHKFEESKQKIIESNLPLVFSIARRFMGSVTNPNFLDAIQDGNIGLMKAAERFDYKRGYKFSTYATWWIRHNIQRGINDGGRTIRHPVYAWDAYYKLRRGEKELEKKLGRPASEEEVATSMKFSVEKVHRLKQLEHRATLSLDRPTSEEDSRTLQDFLVDENTPAPGEKFADEELARKVHESMELLSPREYRVLQERFGLVSRSERTLKEVGGVFGLTRERIRQVQEVALKKLRQNGKLKTALG